MVNNLAAVQANILPPHWAAITNIHANPLCRIIVGWNTKKLTIRSIQATAQWITCEVSNHLMLSGLRLTFVYGSNNYVERTALWNYMQTASVDHASIPWAIMGDFNAVLRPIDRSGGSNSWLEHHEEFPECIKKSSLHQIPYSGIRLTWHNGQTGENTIMKKLDWAFGNYAFQVRWQAAKVYFLPRQESDHSAVILRLAVNLHQGTPSFKFLNQWTEHEDFMDIVRNVWQHRIVGNPLFQLTTKLTILKQHLRKKHRRSTSHISYKVHKAREAWKRAQHLLDAEAHNATLRDMERSTAKDYMKLCKEEEGFYKQRSRIQWLHLGDQNTKFFHRSLIHRRARNNISSLQDDASGVYTDRREIGAMHLGG
ncbi:hypothetical protein OIU84_001774 [Salix udensis]|uniref:Endonuclease/exonuclease/phosphatase domain-containing protein n=1 Tax=Salix udensis TaxID=889485 RepID=A0AAD6P715_9ROSI|nr:hypothetical protein OIU84_001774 [Salix udensis]